MKGAELLVKCLEAEGVTQVYGYPGEENLDLLEALRTSHIHLITARHEQAAGFMAATQGRLTGNPGVCFSTLGPGATNLMTAAAYAQLGGMPMVMITGQKSIQTNDQGRFQVLDVPEMMGPLTKFTRQVAAPSALPFDVREAFRRAVHGRPGAVHLELPEDIARASVSAEPLERMKSWRPCACDAAIAHAADVIRQASRPLVLAGSGTNRPGVSDALSAFIEKQQIPFITTQMGKGSVSCGSDYYIGTASVTDEKPISNTVHSADLVISIGHDVVEKPPFTMEPGEVPVMHLHDASAVVDPVYSPQWEVTGHLPNILDRLNDMLEPASSRNYATILTVQEKLRKSREEGAALQEYPMDPRRLVHEVRQAVPDQGVVTLDNGLYKIWFARDYPAYAPNTLLLDNALASMGAGLPSGIAAALEARGRPVVAVCGDGGFLLNSQELATAVRLDLDLVIVVVNDEALGMIEWKQHHEGLASFGLDLANPSFTALAKAYGAEARCFDPRHGSLAKQLQACIDEGGVHLVEVSIDYAESNRFLSREMINEESSTDGSS